MQLKKKKASLIISFIQLVLAILIFVLYFASIFKTSYPNESLFSNSYYNFILDYFRNLNYQITYSYLVILTFVLPLIFAIFGLFGKLIRTFNILTLIGFSFSIIGYIGLNSFTSDSNAFLNFTSMSTSLFSSTFLAALCGFIFAFINLESYINSRNK